MAGEAPARGFEIALGFALQKIGKAAIEMRRLTGDAQQGSTIAVALGPYSPARALSLGNAMHFAAQRQ